MRTCDGRYASVCANSRPEHLRQRMQLRLLERVRSRLHTSPSRALGFLPVPMPWGLSEHRDLTYEEGPCPLTKLDLGALVRGTKCICHGTQLVGRLRPKAPVCATARPIARRVIPQRAVRSDWVTPITARCSLEVCLPQALLSRSLGPMGADCRRQCKAVAPEGQSRRKACSYLSKVGSTVRGYGRAGHAPCR